VDHRDRVYAPENTCFKRPVKAPRV
jgi:hypothetical protein